jgi:toxin ParE1/3/4
MPRVLLTLQARLDLVETGLYIARENPRAAARWLAMIDQKCKIIAHAPTLGRKREELAPGPRSFPAGDNVIFYRIANNGIEIIRILHGARDIDRFF